MIEFIFTIALIAQPANIPPSTFGQVTDTAEWVHLCVSPNSPLGAIMTSDYPIEEHDDVLVIREASGPEGQFAERIVLRGEWSCISTHAPSDPFDD